MIDVKKDTRREKAPGVNQTTLEVVGWLLFYYGAWNLLDIVGVTDNVVFNVFALAGGLGLIIALSRALRRS